MVDVDDVLKIATQFHTAQFPFPSSIHKDGEPTQVSVNQSIIIVEELNSFLANNMTLLNYSEHTHTHTRARIHAHFTHMDVFPMKWHNHSSYCQHPQGIPVLLQLFSIMCNGSW